MQPDIFEHNFKEKVFALNQIRKPRTFQPSHKIRLAHIVSQVVNLAHPPTKQLFSVITFSDKTWFDLFLLSTEQFVFHSSENPSDTFTSEPSNVIGAELLNYFDKLGVKIHVQPEPVKYEETAKNFSTLLSDLQIDVAVFHGDDSINSLCASMCDVPIRILLDHGNHKVYPCFDLVILSSEEDFKKHERTYSKIGIYSCYLNFSMDSNDAEARNYAKTFEKLLEAFIKKVVKD